jgi:hypothetical protein
MKISAQRRIIIIEISAISGVKVMAARRSGVAAAGVIMKAAAAR